jgi:Acetyl-CoA hydrolase/transferase C-terminal domain
LSGKSGTVSTSFQETGSGTPAWHDAPTRQFVVTLSGTLDFQTRNGEYVTIRPGAILLAEDTADSGHRWKLIDSFALESQDLYTTIRRNADFHCCQVEYTNPPHIIMQNDRAIAINNTTQIDLQGQAASESDGHRHISGTGGQLQFCAGPMRRRAESHSSVLLRHTKGTVYARAGSFST